MLRPRSTLAALSIIGIAAVAIARSQDQPGPATGADPPARFDRANPVALSAARETLAAELIATRTVRDDLRREIARLETKEAAIEAAIAKIDAGATPEGVEQAIDQIPRAEPAPTIALRPRAERDPSLRSTLGPPPAAPASDLGGGFDDEDLDTYLSLIREDMPRYHNYLSRLREENPQKFRDHMQDKAGEWQGIVREARDNPQLFDLRRRTWRLEASIWEATHTVLAATPETDDRKGAERTLRALIGEQFELMLDMSRLRLIDASKLVQQLSAEIDDRSARAAELVDQRYEQMIDKVTQIELRRAQQSAPEDRPPRGPQGRQSPPPGEQGQPPADRPARKPAPPRAR